jgi:internalin A
MVVDLDGWKIAEQRIARESEERTGTLGLAGLGLEVIPKAVAGFTHLRELRLGRPEGDEVNDDAGRSFDARRNTIADLAPLARLTALQSLDCSETEVVDLAPLAGLATLQWLIIRCDNTQIADLAPLAGLTALHSLACYQTQVADLAPLAGIAALRSLSCFNTKVADLAPLMRLTALQWHSCRGIHVSCGA